MPVSNIVSIFRIPIFLLIALSLLPFLPTGCGDSASVQRDELKEIQASIDANDQSLSKAKRSMNEAEKALSKAKDNQGWWVTYNPFCSNSKEVEESQAALNALIDEITAMQEIGAILRKQLDAKNADIQKIAQREQDKKDSIQEDMLTVCGLVVIAIIVLIYVKVKWRERYDKIKSLFKVVPVVGVIVGIVLYCRGESFLQGFGITLFGAILITFFATRSHHKKQVVEAARQRREQEKCDEIQAVKEFHSMTCNECGAMVIPTYMGDYNWKYICQNCQHSWKERWGKEKEEKEEKEEREMAFRRARPPTGSYTPYGYQRRDDEG